MELRSGGVDQFGHEIFTGIGQQIADEIHARLGHDVRTTVLGHIQRGGTPTAFDRVLATRYGVRATRAVHEGKFGTCVALDGEKIINIPLQEAVGHLKTVPLDRYNTAQAMFG